MKIAFLGTVNGGCFEWETMGDDASVRVNCDEGLRRVVVRDGDVVDRFVETVELVNVKGFDVPDAAVACENKVVEAIGDEVAPPCGWEIVSD